MLIQNHREIFNFKKSVKNNNNMKRQVINDSGFEVI